ncbi:hypothetical protein SLEP1_g14910 [Rubroshorea leprosula]|uniref:Uncharacterized protein n=1 Tax=Rubroshorea leprosula TaxID=152421 RepID=A0AAV5IRL2_9ROSI|nr:hypothetical protein SLEP1_g14910 [Rubroshorea leprosula]
MNGEFSDMEGCSSILNFVGASRTVADVASRIVSHFSPMSPGHWRNGTRNYSPTIFAISSAQMPVGEDEGEDLPRIIDPQTPLLCLHRLFFHAALSTGLLFLFST